MKTYKKKTIDTIDKVYCDMCGANCTDQFGHEHAVIEANWGYSSQKDGAGYEVHLCERCFTDVIEFIKKTRKSFLGPFKYPYEYDPLEGRSWL